jgi:hypothetical protein
MPEAMEIEEEVTGGVALGAASSPLAQDVENAVSCAQSSHSSVDGITAPASEPSTSSRTSTSASTSTSTITSTVVRQQLPLYPTPLHFDSTPCSLRFAPSLRSLSTQLRFLSTLLRTISTELHTLSNSLCALSIPVSVRILIRTIHSPHFAP